MTPRTLVYVINDGWVLLGRKRRGFGAGKLVAPGGKIRPLEESVECAIRECQEETGITPTLADPIGHIIAHDPGGTTQVVTVYRTEDFAGHASPTDELLPEWYEISGLERHYDEMFDGDRYWLPMLFRNERFVAEITYDPDWKVAQVHLKAPARP